MSETIYIKPGSDDEEIYTQLLKAIDSLLEPGIPAVSNMSNFVSAIFNSFDKISWCGFYITSGDKLYLGPFCGNVACTEIKIGNGVCGSSALKKETVIVQDVEKFPGHIACDALSKSEIVLPIMINSQLFGVLDLDSYEIAAFNNTDKKYLELLIDIFINKGNPDKYILS